MRGRRRLGSDRGQERQEEDAYQRRHTLSAQGLAWRLDGREVWFTATTSGLEPVSASGDAEWQGTAGLSWNGHFDATTNISKEGESFFRGTTGAAALPAAGPGDGKERDLSWHDWTVARDIKRRRKAGDLRRSARPGKIPEHSTFAERTVRRRFRLGNGLTPTLSRDGKRVLALMPGANGNRNLVELPTGAGEIKDHFQQAKFVCKGPISLQTARKS